MIRAIKSLFESAPLTLRVAILSTPRSGNTWLRALLSGAYQIDHLAVHDPGDVEWSALPSRCVLQLHWHRAEPLLSLLDKHDFRIVSLSRHPLDVLMSILRFSAHEPATAQWLRGEGGNETFIHHAAPLSDTFLRYATGPRAAALLSVSREWWHAPDVHQLRYETLVANPRRELLRIMELLGAPLPEAAIQNTLAANTMTNLRKTSSNKHYWQGQPGLWRQFLPAKEAKAIADAHEPVFRELAYDSDADPSLDAARANANWEHWRRVEK